MNIRHDKKEIEQTTAYNWPQYDEEQIKDVVEVLRSGKVNAWTGTKVREFEQAYAALLGRRHAIALANGTVALDVALHAIGLQPGDEVIVTPRSFVASASCVPMAGAVPVFADVDPESQAITAESIAAVLTPRTRAIIVVHLAGWPADMDPIMRLANQNGIVVIEDCAQAHGAEYAGRPAGSFGHIAAFSFCQDKIITTGGEGGLLAMDDDGIWARAWSFKDHGKTHDLQSGKVHPVGFRWLIETFGSNYRMTEIAAAIGLRQLQRLPSWRAQRAANAALLIDAFRSLPGLRTPEPPLHIRHAWYRLYTFVQPERLRRGWNRDRVMSAINASGVACYMGSCPEIYREKAFVDSGFRPAGRLPTAALLGETSLAFLVDPCQNAVSLQRVADVVANVMRDATKELEPPVSRGRRWVGVKNNARNRIGFVGGQAGRVD
ncbi:DegT/DnrJ/EryC1/StrS aminotransferase family protein [Mesorhizobium sp.]|uniref:DegT/DnrJ/EryC1/StrS family aminotransferase n=1 Tax=Mesorhizobium sp. TaxID=1871066 RepID=UPI0012032957|nr:DegT/DnrJ/EryC1/StrS aminotransferase family protein [Mesorhizobium sp.]TIS55045.1 MAG: DegT/DnrJ/EryC1/StrS aminotransferase family protein [Mesorhizobium sp.]TIS92962.1 MAG: DegT/DnrJ/EryC1/StrS aminotransferase family protein [Mesorhizobium sp.]